MARLVETFELQAEAVEQLLKQQRTRLSAADQKHLACAVRNLAQLGKVRQAVMDHASAPKLDGVESEWLATMLFDLLHLPISDQ